MTHILIASGLRAEFTLYNVSEILHLGFKALQTFVRDICVRLIKHQIEPLWIQPNTIIRLLSTARVVIELPNPVMCFYIYINASITHD